MHPYLIEKIAPRRLGWVSENPHSKAGFIFAVDHPESITSEEVRAAADKCDIGMPDPDGDENDLIFAWEEIASGHAWGAFLSKRRGPRPGSGVNDAVIHLRLPMEQKSAYVKAAQKKKLNLSKWMIEAAEAHLEKGGEHEG